MSSKLVLEVCEREIIFYFPTTQLKLNVISLYLDMYSIEIRTENSAETKGWFMKMKIDIDVRLSVTSCAGYQLSAIKFWSAGNVWKLWKNSTIPLSISATKSGQTYDLCCDQYPYGISGNSINFEHLYLRAQKE